MWNKVVDVLCMTVYTASVCLYTHMSSCCCGVSQTIKSDCGISLCKQVDNRKQRIEWEKEKKAFPTKVSFLPFFCHSCAYVSDCVCVRVCVRVCMCVCVFEFCSKDKQCPLGMILLLVSSPVFILSFLPVIASFSASLLFTFPLILPPLSLHPLLLLCFILFSSLHLMCPHFLVPLPVMAANKIGGGGATRGVRLRDIEREECCGQRKSTCSLSRQKKLLTSYSPIHSFIPLPIQFPAHSYNVCVNVNKCRALNFSWKSTLGPI